MLQPYLYVSLAFFVSYWIGRPVRVYAALLTASILYAGIYEVPFGSTFDGYELLLYDTVALIASVTAGWALALVLNKPPHPMPWEYPGEYDGGVGSDFAHTSFQEEHCDGCPENCSFCVAGGACPIGVCTHAGERAGWWYQVVCAILATLWIGSAITWQVAPQVAWNFFAIVMGSHVLLILFSYFFVPHNAAWAGDLTADGKCRDMASVSSNRAFIAHFHFFVCAILFIDLPFAIARTVTLSDWTYWEFVAAYCAITVYIIGLTTCLRGYERVKVPMITRPSRIEMLMEGGGGAESGAPTSE
jgi:hypothetical protein